ncbi:MAG: carotenoid biosynthesis protein [Fibrobacterota bacterium]
MGNLYIKTFEIFLFTAFFLYFAHSVSKKGLRNTIFSVFPLLIYGWILEQATILSFEAYSYNVSGFIFVIMDAPLCIAAGWSVITNLCIDMAYSLEGLKKPAVLAGVFGLLIDFSMDGLAVFYSFWSWAPEKQGVEHPFFGVPAGNFMAWFTIITSYAFFKASLSENIYKKSAGFAPVIISFITLFIVLTAIDVSKIELLFLHIPWFITYAAVIIPLTIFSSIKLYRSKTGPSRTVHLLYGSFHAFFIIYAVIAGLNGNWLYLPVGITASIPAFAAVVPGIKKESG